MPAATLKVFVVLCSGIMVISIMVVRSKKVLTNQIQIWFNLSLKISIYFQIDFVRIYKSESRTSYCFLKGIKLTLPQTRARSFLWGTEGTTGCALIL